MPEHSKTYQITADRDFREMRVLGRHPWGTPAVFDVDLKKGTFDGAEGALFELYRFSSIRGQEPLSFLLIDDPDELTTDRITARFSAERMRVAITNEEPVNTVYLCITALYPNPDNPEEPIPEVMDLSALEIFIHPGTNGIPTSPDMPSGYPSLETLNAYFAKTDQAHTRATEALNKVNALPSASAIAAIGTAATNAGNAAAAAAQAATAAGTLAGEAKTAADAAAAAVDSIETENDIQDFSGTALTLSDSNCWTVFNPVVIRCNAATLVTASVYPGQPVGRMWVIEQAGDGRVTVSGAGGLQRLGTKFTTAEKNSKMSVMLVDDTKATFDGGAEL